MPSLVGSEMCIRDRPYWEGWLFSAKDAEGGKPLRALIIRRLRILLLKAHNLLELVEGVKGWWIAG